MPWSAFLVPEVRAAMAQQRARQDFLAGQAAGCLMKAAGSGPVPVYALSGRLHLSQSNWLLLDIPNALLRGLFHALDVPGASLPLDDGQLNAHCSVMDADEVAKIGPENISERGKRFAYQLGAVHEVKPPSWDGVGKVWYCKIISPALKDLRKSYGLTPLPHNNEHDFHVTFAVRHTNVLNPGAASKVRNTE